MSVFKHQKKFLSDDVNEHGAICWHVDFESNQKEHPKDSAKALLEHSLDASLRIQDCSRSITLEFGIYGSEDFQERLDKRIDKIDTMIMSLFDMRDALLDVQRESKGEAK